MIVKSFETMADLTATNGEQIISIAGGKPGKGDHYVK